jgi:4-amino-4-deoxy-L-arabinose transferase-like glycosyltransferase
VDGKIFEAANPNNLITIRSDDKWVAYRPDGTADPVVAYPSAYVLGNSWVLDTYSGKEGPLAPFAKIAGRYSALFCLCIVVASTLVHLLRFLRFKDLDATIVGTLVFPAEITALLIFLKLAYVSSWQADITSSPVYGAYGALAIGISYLVATLWTFVASFFRARPKAVRRKGTASRLAVALAIVGIGVVFSFACWHGLTTQSLVPDEYVSILASRHIAQTGFPKFWPADVYYTRSSLFHYTLALTQLIGDGNSAFNLHILPYLWGLATIPMAYKLAKYLGGKWVGVLAALMVGISPFILFYTREVRFYSQITFFTTAAFYFLLKSIEDRKNPRYPVLFFVCFCGSYLGQEFAIATLPATIATLLLCGFGKSWKRGSTWVAGSVTALIMIADLLLYYRFCITPVRSIDYDSMLLLGIHFDNYDITPMYVFLGQEHSQLVEGILFLIGGYIFFILPRKKILLSGSKLVRALYICTFLNLAIMVMIATRPEARYIVHILPAIDICAALALGGLVRRMRVWMRERPVRSRLVAYGPASLALLVVAATVADSRPLRTWNTTTRKYNRDVTGANLFVKDHLRNGDIIVSYSPEATLVLVGKCDYFWRPLRGSIFKYRSLDGALRERNSGAVTVSDSSQLTRAMLNAKRVWIVAPTEIFLPPPNRDPLSYDLDETNQFVLTNFKPVHESFDVKVLLWDNSWNILHPLHVSG